MKTEYYTLHFWGAPERNQLAQAAGQTVHAVPEIRRRERPDNVVDFAAWKAEHCGEEKNVESKANQAEKTTAWQQVLLEAAVNWTVLAVGVALLARILLT